jgi:CheY-like chemotaxis protein
MNKPLVLIVEDEALVGRELKDAFQALGCRVGAVVPSGEEALAYLSSQSADLIIMDIVLRGKLDGIETAREIRRRWRAPLAFLTAFADKNVRDLALMAHPVAVLYKPVTREQLRELIYLACSPAKGPDNKPVQISLWPC